MLDSNCLALLHLLYTDLTVLCYTISPLQGYATACHNETW
jgi:hypothetical protein